MDAKRPDLINATSQTRVNYRLPIVIEGDDVDGRPFREHATVENVTRRGAFVETSLSLKAGGLLALVDASADDRRLGFGQIVWAREDKDMAPGVGMRLVGDNAKCMEYLIAHSVLEIELEDGGDD
ncbi:MAG: hypothetical protein IPF82_20775 [Blastocatellia bacterium]|nr:hypothetical protein [Blastocatellia bacterium]